MAIDCGIHVAHLLTVAVIPGVQQGRCPMHPITEVYSDFTFVSPDNHHEAIDICKQIGTTSAILRLIPSNNLYGRSKVAALHVRLHLITSDDLHGRSAVAALHSSVRLITSDVRFF